MKNTASLDRLQGWLMTAAHQQGLVTDVSFAAYLEELGEKFDRSSVLLWRTGKRRAPGGVLMALIDHAGVPLLRVLAERHGVRLVEETDVPQGNIVDGVLRLTEEVGDFSGRFRAALSDGEVSPVEALELTQQVAKLEAVVARLRGELTTAAAVKPSRSSTTNRPVRR